MDQSLYYGMYIKNGWQASMIGLPIDKKSLTSHVAAGVKGEIIHTFIL